MADDTLGHLMVVSSNVSQVETVQNQFEATLVEDNAECSSVFASRVVAQVLKDVALRSDW